MNKTTTTVLLIIVLIGGFFVFYKNRPLERNTPAINQTNQQTSAKQNLESKIDERASITVTVTPIDISPQSKEWKFNIDMETHSVELDQDITKISVLIDDQGKEYKPIAWEGPVGGHHREGVLAFNQITPTPKSIELKISGIGDVIRSFAWQLE